MMSARRGDAAIDYGTAVVAMSVPACAYLVLLVGVMLRGSYNLSYALILTPLLFILTAVPLSRVLEKVEADRWIRRAVMLGFATKLMGAFARYYVNDLVLGHADASAYYDAGVALSQEFRAYLFGGPAFHELIPNYTGTRFIRLMSGVIYVLLGPSQIAGYVLFTFISFWGLYLFYRAFSLVMPDGNRRHYTVLVFFLPSMVFWPSSIGKEAWMTAMLGLGAYGLARLLTQRRLAYPTLLVALAGMGIVRPHVAAIFGASAGAAFVLRRSRSSGGPLRKFFGLIVLAIAAGLVLNQLQSFFDLQEGLNPQQVLDETTRRSSQGGSQFEAVNPTSPAELPWAVTTVLFRPFLFEAHGLASLVTAMEGSILLGIFLWNIPRLSRLPILMVTRPYIGFAVLYILIFGFAFSAISNFGILARQRTQLFPIAVVVLAVPYEQTILRRTAKRTPRAPVRKVRQVGAVDLAKPGSPRDVTPDDSSPSPRQKPAVIQARLVGRSFAARQKQEGMPRHEVQRSTQVVGSGGG